MDVRSCVIEHVNISIDYPVTRYRSTSNSTSRRYSDVPVQTSKLKIVFESQNGFALIAGQFFNNEHYLENGIKKISA